MTELSRETCLSCLGSGEVSSERGLARCPDCDGEGKIRALHSRNEQRIRKIEARTQRLSGEAAEDTQWLIGELRRLRVALFDAMAVAQEMANKDGSDAEALLHRIQFEANEVLGIYSPSDD
jgi:hypothetical protein